MSMQEYIESLETPAEKVEALDRWCLWYSWEDGEWSEADEAEYNWAVYMSVLLEVDQHGFVDYTPEDLANYAATAKVAA